MFAQVIRLVAAAICFFATLGLLLTVFAQQTGAVELLLWLLVSAGVAWAIWRAWAPKRPLDRP